MKRFISLLLCSLLTFTFISTLHPYAQEEIPEFAKDYYVVNVSDNSTQTLTNATEDGTVELSSGWLGPTDVGTVDLGNGTTVSQHYYTENKDASATYTFTNIPSGKYEVQYYVAHSNSYPYFPIEVSCNGESQNLYIGDLDGTANLSADWYAVTTITQNTSGGPIAVKLTVPDVSFGSKQRIRTSAVRLKPISGEPDYVIRNTALNNYNDSFSADSGFTNSNSSFSCYGETSAAQILSRTAGLSATFNFIKTDSAATDANILSPESYTQVTPGWYDVYYFNPYRDTNNDPQASVEIYHNGATDTCTMDTSVMSVDWYRIVSPIYFSGNGDEYIKITKSDSGSYLRVGAVKLVKKIVISDSETPAVKPVVSAPSYADGKLTVITNGSSLTEDTSIYAIAASYDDNGMLLTGTKTTVITVGAGSDDTTQEIALPDTSGTAYKLFLLDSMSSLKPLGQSYEFSK